MAADLLHRPPKIWKFSDKKRKTKSILSECSFMPFNLQILPPGPLIPVEHVWKLKKSLSLASSCLKNYHQEGWTIEWGTEGRGETRGENRACEKSEETKVLGSLNKRWKVAILREGDDARKGYTGWNIFRVQPAPIHPSNNCYLFS